MANVGCIHILEIVLFPSPPELIFGTPATHGLSVICLLSLKIILKSAKSTALGSVYIASVSALFYTQFVILHFLHGSKCVSVKKIINIRYKVYTIHSLTKTTTIFLYLYFCIWMSISGLLEYGSVDYNLVDYHLEDFHE